MIATSAVNKFFMKRLRMSSNVHRKPKMRDQASVIAKSIGGVLVWGRGSGDAYKLL